MEKKRHCDSTRCFVTLLLISSVFTTTQARVLNMTVILSATDGAVSVRGGYVVPLNNSLTLKCHATTFTSEASLQWNITLVGSTSVRGNGGTLASIGQGKYSLPKGIQTENPTLLRVHNLQLNESGSTIQCGVPDNLRGGYHARSQAKFIFVEGAPLCPNVTLNNAFNYIITWSLDGQVLLPVTYTISVRNLSGEIILTQNTSQTQFELTGPGIPTLTNYTVAVVACTRAGCSQNCDHTWFSVPPKVSKPGTDTQGTALFTAISPSSVSPGHTEIIVAVVCGVVGIGIMIVVAMVITSCMWCIVRKRKSKKYNVRHSVEGIDPMQTLKNSNDGILGEYATVTDVVKSPQLHTPSDKSIPPSSHHSNVTDTEGYGTIQNAAKSPQKIRNEGSFKRKPATPTSTEYAVINNNTKGQTVPIAAAPSEYAQVPDSIQMKPPLQRRQSISTPSSISDCTPLSSPPPLPPPRIELSPEYL